MPVLILAGLIALAVMSRRKAFPEVPGPLIAALLFGGLALLLGQGWLLYVGAVVALIWLSHNDPARKHRKQRRKAVKRARRAELADASRSFQAELGQFLRDIEEYRRPTPAPRDVAPAAPQASLFVPAEPEPPQDELSQAITALLRRHGKKLPPEAVRRIEDFRLAVAETMSFLSAHEGAAGPSAFLVRQSALDYLPGAVNAYLRLPSSLADTALLDGGKTGKDLLLGQLDMLHEAVQQVLVDATRAEGAHLLTHQRFLEDRLAHSREDFKV